MAEKRKYLGIHFQCCKVYTRIYLNQEKTAYQGRCPRCGRLAQVKIGHHGTDSRFFIAQ